MGLSNMSLDVRDGSKAYFLEYRGDNTPGHQPFWLYNENGEGMELSEKDVFDALDKYFKENF